jgi:hypothetical protein
MFSRGFTVLPRHATLARVTRWATRLVVLVSLLLLIGTTFAWAYSYWVYDTFRHDLNYNTATQTHVFIDRYSNTQGQLTWLRQSWTFPHDSFDPPPAESIWSREPASSFQTPRDTLANRLGFGQWTARFPKNAAIPIDYRQIWCPHWLIAALAAVAPQAWLIARFRRRRRHLAGHCLSCGYDLRATPDRCPECGATPARAVA